jgi:hypothetical protein
VRHCYDLFPRQPQDRRLRRRPAVCGILYGLMTFAVMNLVVLPLSAIGHVPQFSPVSLTNGLLIHAFGVGLPTAVVVARGR